VALKWKKESGVRVMHSGISVCLAVEAVPLAFFSEPNWVVEIKAKHVGIGSLETSSSPLLAGISSHQYNRHEGPSQRTQEGGWSKFGTPSRADFRNQKVECVERRDTIYPGKQLIPPNNAGNPGLVSKAAATRRVLVASSAEGGEHLQKVPEFEFTSRPSQYYDLARTLHNTRLHPDHLL
jgi:hypothetical protein